MESDQLSLPAFPMPHDRVTARHHALVREIRTAAGGRRRPAYWKVAAPIAVAGAVVAAIAVGDLTTSRVSLTASWTPVPTPVAADRLTSVGRSCQAHLARQPWPVTVTDLTVVLAEQRGRLTAVLLSGDGQYGMCVGDVDNPLFAGVGTPGPFDPARGLALDGDPGQLNGADPFRLVYGQVAPGVARVVVDVADGRQVDATVSGGRFFAWWPSGADARTITASAAGGGVVGVVHPAPAPLSPAPVRKPGG